MTSRRLFLLGLLAVLGPGCIASADEKVLYETKSRYTTIVVTEDHQGLRTLWFEKGGAKQSVVKVGDPDHVELPYARVMVAGLALVDEPQRILIVGLGGGTIPGLLHKHYPRTTIDVVDIDAEVVAVAKKFFGFREDATLHAHAQDGRKFIEECREPYDIIFLDAYSADNVPYALATREFLQAVRRALTPKGIVVGNLWSRESNDLYDDMVRTYQDVFNELYILDVRDRGNRILLAIPRKERIRREEMARRATAVSREKRFRFDMGGLVEYGYRYMGKKNSRGRVLTDKKKAT